MKKQVGIIGGGPSAFLLAAFLDAEKFTVTIYEKNKTAGRKFLVAGKGGFNLTHSEPINLLIKRYTANVFLDKVLHHFTNNDFRNWLELIGISTYIGSSKRMYPKEGIKPIAVLNAILKTLKEKQELKIVFEDDALIIIHKPAELLSVPGKEIKDSVYTRIKKTLPKCYCPPNCASIRHGNFRNFSVDQNKRSQ